MTDTAKTNSVLRRGRLTDLALLPRLAADALRAEAPAAYDTADVEALAMGASAARFATAVSRGHALVIEQDREIVAFAAWDVKRGAIELKGVFVAPDAMRQGLATALVEAIADTVSAAGGGTLEVAAPASAMPFLGRRGFLPAELATGADVPIRVVMRRRIAAAASLPLAA